MSEIHCVVSGHVQGVGFREYIQRSADKYELTGWVRNRQDGTVELVAQGVPDSLKEFIECVNEGALGSAVEGVSVDWRTAKRHYEEFSIRYD